jgi:aspartyl-tRNA(Asn)/glutamyl-tRNA(Gln) amidotransferase subunit A
MTISDYLNQPNKLQSLSEIITQAKIKNQSNPAVLSRTDEYVSLRQEEQFWKSFAGCPIVIKDNILLQDTVSTLGSLMWGEYRAPYSSTVARKLEEAGFLVIGKTAMDEFAMGTTGENTSFALPHNPYDESRVAGGSSSGSAVAVATDMVSVALWSDTGGSIRLPASFCGIIGLKPTYGAVSRYGVQAMASSFDQVGVCAKTIDDTQAVFDVIKGIDPLDATTQDYIFHKKITSLQGLRIGLPKQYFDEGLDPQVKETILATVDKLVEQWAVVVELDIPLIDAWLSAYYTLVNSEASTNMARFDGLKFWLQQDTNDSKSHMEYLASIRDQWFGPEVKRRILLGAHILSASEYEGLYVKAMNIRTLVTQQFKNHFAHDVDVIMWPTVPLLPRGIGAKVDDPVAMYLADAYTVIANLTGCPAISVPVGFGEENWKKLPIWLQIMGDHCSEYDLFEIGRLFKL